MLRESNYKNPPGICQYIPSLCLPGHKQMALDVLMLERSIKEKNQFPKLRFYTWDGPWLSLGRNQNDFPQKWASFAKEGRVNIVRRPSGGNAVLHGGGLTYAFVWPNAPRRRHESYQRACKWLIDGFKDLGMPLHFGDEISHLTDKHCFSQSTKADLIDQRGNKRIGSAQFWKSSQLLQHGEILLDPPKELWEELFDEKAPEKAPKSIPRVGLENSLKQAWLSSLGEASLQKKVLTKRDLNELSENAASFLVHMN